MTEFNFDEYVNHLEYLGYDLLKEEIKGVIKYHADHPFFGGIILDEYFCGVISTDFYGPNEHTQNKDKNYELLKTINDLNRKTYVSIYNLGDDGLIRKTGFYLGTYNKKAFGSFVQLWNWDINTEWEHKDFQSFFPL
jgi:hypothetical protein